MILEQLIFARRLLRTASVACLALASTECNKDGSTAPRTQTTLYVFATFAAPSITVTVNNQALGQVTQQYSGKHNCDTLAKATAADGVLSVGVVLGAHYDIGWTFTGGGVDGDTFQATSDFVDPPCLMEAIAAPTG